MEAYYAVCAGLVTLSLLVLVAMAVAVLWEAKTALLKVERLTDHVDERVESVKGIFSVVDRFTWSMQSGWARGIDIALGLLSTLKDRHAANGGKTETSERSRAREKTS